MAMLLEKGADPNALQAEPLPPHYVISMPEGLLGREMDKNTGWNEARLILDNEDNVNGTVNVRDGEAEMFRTEQLKRESGGGTLREPQRMPLHLAVKLLDDMNSMLKLLINNGANITGRDSQGNTALVDATATELDYLLELFIQKVRRCFGINR